MASLAPIDAAMYSASVELWATDDCFLLNHDIIADPKVKQHLDVPFRSMEFPVQSESVNPLKFNSVLLYLRPYKISKNVFYCY